MQVCPKRLSQDNYDMMTVLPPVVRKPDDIIFPFCIARGGELEKVTQRASAEMTDMEGLVRCSRLTWYPTLANGGNATGTIKICETSPKA